MKHQEEEYPYEMGFDGEEDQSYQQSYWLSPRIQPRNRDNLNYSVMPMTHLLQKIYQECQEKTIVTGMDKYWTLMLYYISQFQQEILVSFIDQDMTGRQLIKYHEDYQSTQRQGDCQICLTKGTIISNSCDHAFCLECWSSILEISHTQRNHYQLFPMCPMERCYHKMHFLLMQVVWQAKPTLKPAFERVLCQKYCQQSDKIRLCPSNICNCVIYINYELGEEVECICGETLCRICGERWHFPLKCGDLELWNREMEALNNQQKQIFQTQYKQSVLCQLVIKQCPKCKTQIVKDGGCLHVHCLCGFHFCWICLKEWFDHPSFFRCGQLSEFQLNRRQRQKRIQSMVRKDRLMLEKTMILITTQSQSNQFQAKSTFLRSLPTANLNDHLDQYFVYEIDFATYSKLWKQLIISFDILSRKPIYNYLQSSMKGNDQFESLSCLANNLYNQVFNEFQNKKETRNFNPDRKNTINLFSNISVVKDLMPYFEELIQNIKKLPL